MEHGSSAGAVGGDKLELFKNQAKQLLKKLTPRSAAKLSIDSNPYIFQYVVSRVLRNWFSIETFRTLLRISSFYFSMYSYMIDNGICYLTLTDKSYPKRLAFLFLEEISKDFEADLRAEHGDEYVLWNSKCFCHFLYVFFQIYSIMPECESIILVLERKILQSYQSASYTLMNHISASIFTFKAKLKMIITCFIFVLGNCHYYFQILFLTPESFI